MESLRYFFVATILLVIVVSAVNAQDRVWSCNFQNNHACGADLEAVGNNVRFEFQKGPTYTDDTGPPYDHSLKDPSTGIYIYLDASNRSEGNQAIMHTPKWRTGTAKCLEFFYHMYSGSPADHQGTLRVEAMPMDKIVFSVNGSQGNKWKLARFDLDYKVESVTFRAIRGPYHQSDIAIDDIFVAREECTVQGSNRPGPGPSREDEPRNRNPNDPFFQADRPQMIGEGQRSNAPIPSFLRDPREEFFEVRLKDGRNEREGRLEVFVQGKWGTVCSDGWTQLESFAACRTLGLSLGEKKTAPESSRLLSNDDTPIWLDGVRCSLDSRLIKDCCRNELGVHDCDHSKDVYLLCGPESINTRLPCPPGATHCRREPLRAADLPELPGRSNPQNVPAPSGHTDPPPSGHTDYPRRPTDYNPPRPHPDPPGPANNNPPRTPQPAPSPGSAPPPLQHPLPPMFALPPERPFAKSDFNVNSPENNGLNFTNDGYFYNEFRAIKELRTADEGRYWMEMYTSNNTELGGYARLKSGLLRLPNGIGGCLVYRILTADNTRWTVSYGNKIGRLEIELGDERAREGPEKIISQIKPSHITTAPFFIFIEAWVSDIDDLFAVDDIEFYTIPCPRA